MTNKPEGATHLENTAPSEEAFLEEELLEIVAGARSAEAAIPDPTDEILLSPNYTSGWPAGAPAGITIHTEEGYHDSSVSWLRNRASGASAHWCVRRDGKIVQLVWEKDRAWHAKSGSNYYFGIEHEGSSYPNNPRVNPNNVPCFWTTPKDADRLRDDDKMLKESARLSAYLCSKYRLDPQHDFNRPARRDTESVLAGHDQMYANDHIDPNSNSLFPWKAYINEVKALMGHKKFKPAPDPKGPSLLKVQSGAFRDRKNAEKHAAMTNRKGFSFYIVQDGNLYKVQHGAFSVKRNAENLEKLLEKKGIDAFIVEGDSPKVLEAEEEVDV